MRLPRVFRPLLIVCMVAIAGAALAASPPSVFAQAADPVATSPVPPSPASALEPGTPPVLAPNTAAPSTSTPAPPRSEDQVLLDAWKAELDGIAQASRRPGVFDRELSEFSERAELIRQQASAMAQRMAPIVSALEARLRELQPPPAPADKDSQALVESEAVKAQRETLSRDAAQSRGVLQQAQEAAVRADQISRTAAEARRSRITEELLARTRSVLDPTFWIEAIGALPAISKSATLLSADWLAVLAKRGTGTALFAMLGALLVAGMLLLPVRNWLHRRTVRDADARPTRLAAYLRALSIVLVNVGVPLVGLALIYLSLKTFDLMPRRIEQLVVGLILAALSFFAITGLSRGLLAPRRGNWRLIPLNDEAAGVVHGLLTTSALVVAASFLAKDILSTLFAPNEASAATYAAFAALISLSMIGILRALALAAHALEDVDALQADLDGRPAHPHGRLWGLVVPVAWIVTIASLGALVTGVVRLAEFILIYAIWTSCVLALLYVIIGVIDESTTQAMRAGSSTSRSIARATGLSGQTIEQFGVVLSGVLRLLLIAFGLLLSAAPLGVTSDEMLGAFRSAFFGFQLGGLSFSLSTLLGALVVFVLGVWIASAVKGWLEESFLPRTRLDAGLRNSINTSIGYVGYVIAAMVALSFAGLDLDNIAIVAGALSVGIGFGLQSIVNNFVSGLIPLAERPIKAGDLVEVNGERGHVRKINVRATEIDTYDRASLIVPNSALITGNVKNWMHRDTLGRVLIEIGVAYESDPEQVREATLACARTHPLILRFPEPSVFLIKFGESTLDFRLVAAVASVATAFQTESDLRFAILKRMRDDGIAIPYAQREVSIPTMEPLSRVAEQLLRGELPINLTPKSG